jgi:hypothetical protein
MNDRTTSPLVFHNKTAIFNWIFIGFFDAGVLAATWLFLRDSPNESIWWLVFFWSGAILASWWAASQQYIQVQVSSDNAKIIKLRPFKKEVIYFGSQDVKRLAVIKTRDSEGDPYFICELEINQTTAIKVVEGHHQPTVELAAAQLRQALGLRN